tara:strand:+ start:616 stop:831 length:216 start_codon:yes stop_codon:yes gene_type:complete
MKKYPTSPTLFERMFIKVFSKLKSFHRIIDGACEESFRLGYDRGYEDASSQNTKKKFKKALQKLSEGLPNA